MSHDCGGDDVYLKLDLSERKYELWERSVHAAMVVLVSKRLLTVDEMRRGIEALPEDIYNSWGYYGKWAASIAQICIERGTFTEKAFDEALGYQATSDAEILSNEPRFKPGDHVRVLQESARPRWRKPHLRTPGYIFGAKGVVERIAGRFGDPEFLAYRSVPTMQVLYRVRFHSSDLWRPASSDENESDTANDTVDVEIFESWLAKTSMSHDVTDSSIHGRAHKRARHHDDDSGHNLSHGRDPSHHHDHQHDDRAVTEQNALDKEGQETIEQRVSEALIAVLAQKSSGPAIVSPSELTAAVENVDRMGGSGEGPRLVARAWVDAAFKSRLIQDANAAARELGIGASNSAYSTQLTAVANTADVHNVVVCTLCSCYPLAILGLSPPWYKSRSYRARMVKEPRKVLLEFGTSIGPRRSVRVHDSTADLRYIVIPVRPKGTEDWSEQELQKIVTRDSMIGVREVTLG